MTAEINSNDLLDCILTSHYNDRKWKDTSHGYIIYWLEQVCLYHDNSEQHFGD